MFANPIIGGENSLIRTAIQSPDYVQGVSGWSINKNGTAEFNNVDVRITDGSGVVISGGTQSIEFHLPDNTSSGIDIFYGSIDAAYSDSITTGFAELRIKSPVVRNPPAPFTTDSIAMLKLRSKTLDNTDPTVYVSGQMSNDQGGYYGKGLISRNVLTADGPPTGSTETVQMDILHPNGIWPANRAYKVEVIAGFSTSQASKSPIWRVRKGNAAGATVCYFGRTPSGSTANEEDNLTLTQMFVTGANDVNTGLVLSVVGDPANVWTARILANNPKAVINVYDIGPVTDYTGVRVLT